MDIDLNMEPDQEMKQGENDVNGGKLSTSSHNSYPPATTIVIQ